METPSKNARNEIPNQLVLEEIVPRIPTKSLCRFKSVSHEWNSVIKNVKLASRSVLTVARDDKMQSVEFYGDVIIDSNTFDGSITPPSYLISSCNGLALMISLDDNSEDTQEHLPDYLHMFDFSYVVYNPFLGVDHFIDIPHPEEIHLADCDWGNRNYNFGFGYVSSKDDYYIVAIDSKRDSEIRVYTYSLRSQQWNDQTVRLKGAEEVALPLKFQDFWCCQVGTLVNEALHWGMLEGNNNRFIFAYDLVSLEEWRLIDLPYHGFGNPTMRYHSFSVTCLDDCLCAWANYDNVVEMWMMKQYGVVESWTKLFHLQLDDDLRCRRIFGLTKPNIVLVFTNCLELIPVDFSCDPPKVSKAVLEDVWEAVSYIPSHVSVFALISEPSE